MDLLGALIDYHMVYTMVTDGGWNNTFCLISDLNLQFVFIYLFIFCDMPGILAQAGMYGSDLHIL